jgi:hypothetical protein
MCNHVQGLCGKIRAEIAAMAPNSAIVHQAVFQKDLLAGNDFVGREDHAARGIDEVSGIRGAFW